MQSASSEAAAASAGMPQPQQRPVQASGGFRSPLAAKTIMKMDYVKGDLKMIALTSGSIVVAIILLSLIFR
jgi:hypothetical protein